MKKIISLILVLLMLVSSLVMTSCFEDREDDGDGDKEINVKSAMEAAGSKMDTVDSCTGNSTLTIDLKSGGMTITMEMIYNIKMAGLQSDNPLRYADVIARTFGAEETGVMYTENGWDYFVVGNEKYKTQVEEDNDASYDGFADSIYDNAKVEKTDKGNSIKMTFTEEQFLEYFPTTFDSALEMFDFQEYRDYAVVSDASVKVLIDKDGYASEEHLNFKVTISYQGETIEIVFSSIANYTDFNKPVTITPPEGYESFTERLDGDII